MSEELIENVYSSRHSKSPTFSNCGKFIFFLQEFGQESCLAVANLDGNKFRIEIDSNHSDNITEIYSSRLTNHIAILTQRGSEKAQIHVYHWQTNDETIILEFEYSTADEPDEKSIFGADLMMMGLCFSGWSKAMTLIRGDSTNGILTITCHHL